MVVLGAHPWVPTPDAAQLRADELFAGQRPDLVVDAARATRGLMPRRGGRPIGSEGEASSDATRSPLVPTVTESGAVRRPTQFIGAMR